MTTYCTEEPGPIQSLDQLPQDDPICWLNEGAFSAAVLNRIYTCLLNHLPYYQNERKELLDGGVKVPGEIGDSLLSLPSPINRIMCEANTGALSVVEEVQSESPPDEITIMPIRNSIVRKPRNSKTRDDDVLNGVRLEEVNASFSSRHQKS